MIRTLLSGFLAGIAMYAWSTVAHIVTPLGQVGIQNMPNEQPVLDALHTALGTASGLYMYPGMDMSSPSSMKAQMDGYEKKLAKNPGGLLIYRPPGGKAMENSQLVIEFLVELVEAMLAVYLLSLTNLSSFGSKVGFVTLIGIIAAIATNIPYWNWYGFPTNYTTTYMFVGVVGYLLAGIVAGLMIKRSA